MSNPLPKIRLKATEEDAFTLLELLIVSALIAIMLTLSVPAFRPSLLNDPLRQAARKVIGTMNEARQAASRSSNGCFINLNISENQIGYHCPQTVAEPTKGSDSDEESTHVIELPEQVRISSVWRGTEQSVTSGDVSLWVNHNGLMDQAIINLTDEEKEMSLISSVFVAEIRLEDGSITPEDL